MLNWSRDSAGYRGTDTLHSVPDVLPEVHTAAWENLLVGMRRHFLTETRHLRPPVGAARVFICHPSQEAVIDQLREIHNGEVIAEEGGELPRVWRWEHQLRIFWVIELPASMSRHQFEHQFAA